MAKTTNAAFETVYRIRSDFSDEKVNAVCTLRRSKLTGMHVILERIPADCVYANFLFLTPTTSDRPLAACVQRLTCCGSENFPPEFVSRVEREIPGAYTGVSVHHDRTVYTLNAETDRGLIALLPPYLDALFLPKLAQQAFDQCIFKQDPIKGDFTGNMYRDLLEAEQLNPSPLQELHKDIYPDKCPYHWNVDGTTSALTRVTLAEVRNYHQTHYRPSNCFVIVAGNVSEDDILEVISAFEQQLPQGLVNYSRQNPPRVVAPSTAPKLLQPMEQVKIDTEPSTKSKRDRESQALPLVRFSSVVYEAPTNPPAVGLPGLGKACLSHSGSLQTEPTSSLYDLHIVFQGPDFINHESWSAFSLLARHIRDAYNEEYAAPKPKSPLRKHVILEDCSSDDDQSCGPFENFSLTWVDRKWPLAIFTSRCLLGCQVADTKRQFFQLVSRLTTPGDLHCMANERNLHRLLAAGEQAYADQLRWRAEYDVVVSLGVWAASVDLHDPEAKDCFQSCVHPAYDYRRLRLLPARWWDSLINTHLSNAITVVDLSDLSQGALEQFGSSRRKSSRWTLSSAQSESRSVCDDRPRERNWTETDNQVEAYLESIGGRGICQALISAV